MKIEIKHKNGTILFSGEFETLRTAVESAVKQGAYLEGANLRGANLRGADLRGADLEGADLGGADLRDTDLGGADLGGADLEGANLRGATYGEGVPMEQEPVQILALLPYPVIIFDRHMKIGCELHGFEDWSAMSKKQLAAMASDAVDLTDKYRRTLEVLLRAARPEVAAIKTGEKE